MQLHCFHRLGLAQVDINSRVPLELFDSAIRQLHTTALRRAPVYQSVVSGGVILTAIEGGGARGRGGSGSWLSAALQSPRRRKQT